MDQSFSLFLSVRPSILALILRRNKSARAARRGFFASFQTKMPGVNFRRPKWCNFGTCAHLTFFGADLRPFYTFLQFTFASLARFLGKSENHKWRPKALSLTRTAGEAARSPCVVPTGGLYPNLSRINFLGPSFFWNKFPFPKKGTAPRRTWHTKNIQNQFWDQSGKHLWIKFQWPRSCLSLCKSPTNSAPRNSTLVATPVSLNIFPWGKPPWTLKIPKLGLNEFPRGIFFRAQGQEKILPARTRFCKQKRNDLEIFACHGSCDGHDF